MNNIQKAKKEVNSIAKKYTKNPSAELKAQFNTAVSNWCKLDAKKTINFLKDPQNNVIVSMEVKKTFEHKGFNFAIVLEPKATHKYYTLINFETGGKMTMVSNDKKTIKNFYENSITALDTLINRIGLTDFQNVLNSYPKIN
jgi:hypothetical protein